MDFPESLKIRLLDQKRSLKPLILGSKTCHKSGCRILKLEEIINVVFTPKLKPFAYAAAVAILSAVAVNSGKVQAATIFNGGSPNVDNGYDIESSSDYSLASFQLSTSDSLASVTFYAGSVDGSTLSINSVDYAIYDANASGTPNLISTEASGSGTDLSVVQNGNVFSGPEYAITFDLSTAVPLTSGTTYWLGLYLPGNGSYSPVWVATNNGDSPYHSYTVDGGLYSNSDNVAFTLSDTASGSTSSVPEPLTTLGTLTAAGFGVALRRRQKLQQRVKS